MPSLNSDLDIPHELDVPIGPQTWYGVGGKAAVLAHPQSLEQLAALAKRCHQEGRALYVLGAGANLLVRDEGVPGVVVKLDAPAFRQIKLQKHLVTVGAGYDLQKLVLETAKHGLSGLECLAGIPASVGGAVRMNAGGTFGDIGRSVKSVRVMESGGDIDDLDVDALIFSYRKSNITAKFILEVCLTLTPADPQEVLKEVKRVYAVKAGMQPLGANSAGCAFKNPPPGTAPAAGQLIDRAGLKGFRVGGASVSLVHANFVVADKDCRAADILAVMDYVQNAVKEKFGVELEREVVVWP